MITWKPDREGLQLAELGPLTLLVEAHRNISPGSWWKREIEGYSWRFGPTPHSVLRATCGPLLAIVEAGGTKPGERPLEEEAKRLCYEAALAFGRAIVAAGEDT